MHLWEGGESGGRERESRGDSNQQEGLVERRSSSGCGASSAARRHRLRFAKPSYSALHGAKASYQPEAAQISLLSRAASREAAVRQSSPDERKP
jgi:hypothetical protein